MKFAARILYFPIVLFAVAACIFLSLELLEPIYNEKQEVENIVQNFPFFPEGMTYPSRALNSSVHLAFVVDNATSAITLMKSVLIHRHSRIHFHLITVDTIFENIINTLMKSWELPEVIYSIYPISKLKANTTWLPGEIFLEVINDLTKLHLPSILPATLDRVIVLDSQLIMVDDVWNVWRLFLQPEIKNKPITISRTNSIDCEHFDGALVLYNLSIMRSIEWKRIWHMSAQKLHNPLHSFTYRRIINNIIANFPTIHSLLPSNVVGKCTTENIKCPDYNNMTNSYFVVLKDIRGKNCENQHLLRYYSVEKSVNEHDSVSMKWVARPTVSIMSRHPVSKKPKLSRGRICRVLREDSHLNYITRLFHTGGFYKPKSEYETTLVTQLSINRLEMFVKLMDHWTGPASIAMYGDDSEVWHVIEFLNQFGFVQRRNLAIHFVLKQSMFYPVNYLRNVALSNVKTKYVFLDDADFLPSFGLHERLLVYNKHLLSRREKMALVIPAFETHATNLSYPSNKESLLSNLEQKKVTTFCPRCKHQTHAPTRYQQWYESLYPYEVDWAFHFEPYVVVKSNVVPYSRQFMGYGWNKVSQITELKAKGYQFVVIPDHYIIHMPHKTTKDKSIWYMGAFKYCINRVWKRFIAELKQKYGANCLAEKKDASTTVFNEISINEI